MARAELMLYCPSLKTSTMVIGWLRLVWILIAQGCYMSLEGTGYLRALELHPYIKGLIISTLPVVILVTASLISLLYGVYSERKYFLLPYIAIAFVELMKVSFDWVVVTRRFEEPILFIFAGLSAISVLIFFFYVVIKFYIHLAHCNSEANAEKINEKISMPPLEANKKLIQDM